MKRTWLLLIVVMALLTAAAPPAYGCTIFSAADGDSVLFGNNEDWFEKDTYIWFVPQTTVSFGRVCVGFENAHPQGGMNEKGMAIDWVAWKDALPENLAPASPEKKTAAGDINDLLLATCASVDDVIAFYQEYNDPNLGYATLLAADSRGKVVTITWDNATKKPMADVTAGAYRCAGYGSVSVNAMFDRGQPVTEEGFRSLLEAAEQDGLTLYSNVFNLKTGDITLYHAQNFDEAVHFNLHDELQQGAHLLHIPTLFEAEMQAGEDVFSPETLLPLYLRIVIWALAALLALYAAFCAVSLIRCVNPFVHKSALRYIGIAAAAAALVLLVMLYFRWYFAVNYGFGLLGFVPAVLSLAFLALAAGHMVLSVLAVVRKSLSRVAAVVHIAAAALMILVAAEFVISGFVRI